MQDTIRTDSQIIRPLPKWLTDQKAGITKTRTAEFSVRPDRSLPVSVALTSGFMLLVISIITVIIIRKFKKKV